MTVLLWKVEEPSQKRQNEFSDNDGNKRRKFAGNGKTFFIRRTIRFALTWAHLNFHEVEHHDRVVSRLQNFAPPIIENSSENESKCHGENRKPRDDEKNHHGGDLTF